MVIASGLYRLRAPPGTGVGGMYATNNGFERPISVAAEVPPLFERQVWNVRLENPETNEYVIWEGHAPPGVEIPGFSYHEPVPGQHIILARPKAFLLEHAPHHDQHAYVIRLVNPLIGVDLVVGVKEDRLVIDAVLPQDPSKRPVWEFHPVTN